MSVHYHRYVRWFGLVLGVSCSSSCASDATAAHEVTVRTSPLELACATAPPHVAGDVTSIIPSFEPLDPSRPQAYGSEHCAGFIFEFDNPDEEPLRGAWIQASGHSSSGTDVLSDGRCHDRALEVDYYGYEKREWSKLASASASGSFEPGALASQGYCRLEALIEHPESYEKLRIVARVTDGSDTYPMYACLW